MRILFVSDAWEPQINGVVRTLQMLKVHLHRNGHEVCIIGPDAFRSMPCPCYPEIRLALFPRRKLRQKIRAFKPDVLHICTEGPLGRAARNLALKADFPFTTDYHTRFPEYLKAMLCIPPLLTIKVLKQFHRPSRCVMVPTETMAKILERRGFNNVAVYPRGVDTQLFHPDKREDKWGPRPVFLYIGRLSKEKSIEDFLNLNLNGCKVVVGDGPIRTNLESAYPDVRFTGALTGEDLARAYAAGDVFVFPSKTDTFGMVLLEALASGLPVAAYPVEGPRDVLKDDRCAALHEDLKTAIDQATALSRSACRAYALNFSWENVCRQFLNLTCPGDPAIWEDR